MARRKLKHEWLKKIMYVALFVSKLPAMGFFASAVATNLLINVVYPEKRKLVDY